MPSLASTTILIVLLLSRGSSALLLAFDPNENTCHEEQHGGDRQADEDGDGRARGELPFDSYLWGRGVVVVGLVVVGAAGAADYDGHGAGVEEEVGLLSGTGGWRGGSQVFVRKSWVCKGKSR